MTHARTKYVMAAAIVATGMAFIDTTALNVALDSIRNDLAATNSQLLWTLNSYALALTALLLAAGGFSDRFGHRLVFGLGVVSFALFSAACGLSTSIHWLIVFRVFQGLGAALMIPGSLILICDVYPAGQRGKAIGVWTGCSVLMMTVGPIIGGVLADHGWWRMIFFLNIPLSIFVIVCVRLTSHAGTENRTRTATPIDGWGMVMGALGLVLVSFGCIQISDSGLQPLFGLAIVAGLAILVQFGRHEARIEFPMLPVSLIKEPRVLAACLIMLVIYSAFHAMLVFIPLRLIQIDELSALFAGVAQLPTLGGLIVVSPLAGIVFDRCGAKLPLVLGIVIGAVGFALLAILANADSYWVCWFPGLTLLGIGLSFSMTSLGTMLMNSVTPDRLGIASSLNSAVSRLASVIGVAVLGGIGFALLRHGLGDETSLAIDARQIQSIEYREAFERMFVTLAGISAAMLAGCLGIVAWLIRDQSKL